MYKIMLCDLRNCLLINNKLYCRSILDYKPNKYANRWWSHGTERRLMELSGIANIIYINPLDPRIKVFQVFISPEIWPRFIVFWAFIVFFHNLWCWFPTITLAYRYVSAIVPLTSLLVLHVYGPILLLTGRRVNNRECNSENTIGCRFSD